MEQVVIVTGGGRGIGREIAIRVSEKGNRCIIVDKDFEKAKETENLIKQSGFIANSYYADLSKSDDVIHVFQQIFNTTQKIDAIINNAGGYYLPKSIEEITIDFWNLVIDTNLKTTFLCSLEAFKYMKMAKYGKIVNFSSSLVFTSGTGLSPYISAKAGIIGLTRALAMDMGAYNITVNAIAPGLTATDDTYKAFGTERFKKVKQMRAIKREQLPRDLIGAILFLIDPSSNFITGQTLVVDGGRAFI